MADFIIINNYDNTVMEELEGWDFTELVAMSQIVYDDQWLGDWFSVYHVGDTATMREAVYDDGKWYEADGYTPLAY